jgi:hypothetical protein
MNAPSIPTDVQNMATEIAKTLGALNALEVSSEGEYREAVDALNAITSKRKTLEEKRLEITRPLDAAKKAIMDFFRAPADVLDKAERVIKGALSAFEVRRRERIEAERRELQRKADEAAAAERKRLAAEAERLAAEGRVETAALKIERAETLQAREITTVPGEKVKGVSYRTTWNYRIADADAIPREFMMVDEQKIRRYVSAMKGDTKIAGVEVFTEQHVAATGRGRV